MGFTSALVVEDPFEGGRNVALSVSRQRLANMVATFTTAGMLLDSVPEIGSASAFVSLFQPGFRSLKVEDRKATPNNGSGCENGQEQKASSVPGAQDWPPSLKAYVSKCFNACVTTKHKDMVEIVLEGKITAAVGSNAMWSKEWDKEELPGVLAKVQAKAEEEKC